VMDEEPSSKESNQRLKCGDPEPGPPLVFLC